MLERYRNHTIVKNRLKANANIGRFYAHVKHEEMKHTVESIHKKEESEASKGRGRKSLSQSDGYAAPDFEVEDQFKLPYGLGFDNVIKKKADLVNSQKVFNNKVMDDLIESLGYMDYRDALACNKYIIEAKK